MPHIVPIEGTFHVTFRVKNSIPTTIVNNLAEKFIQQKTEFQSNIYEQKERSLKLNELYQLYYEEFETELHKNVVFPLANEAKATIVKNALHFYDKQRYQLICYSIMPSHVHIIFLNVSTNLATIMKSIKGFTAHEINKLDNTKGNFWQDESYDHLIKDRNELAETIEYVLNNPVKSGFCEHHTQHPFTWCKEGFAET